MYIHIHTHIVNISFTTFTPGVFAKVFTACVRKPSNMRAF